MSVPQEKATRQHTKDHNSRLVLQTIYNARGISRAELARATRLTRTTISDVVNDLIAQGLVEEVGMGTPGVGRTPTILSVVDDSRHIIAVDITNTELKGAVMNLRGTIRRHAVLPLSGENGDQVLALLFPLIDSLINTTSVPLLGIGISSPGMIDTVGGMVRRTISFNWQNLPLRTMVQDRYSLPVYIANDSNMVALAMYMFGPHRRSSSVVAVKVGRGIGAGIVLNGQLLYGDTYGTGEIGHVVVEKDGRKCECGNYGCLETVANIPTIIRRAQIAAQQQPDSLLHRLAPDDEPMTVEIVLTAFMAGDEAAREIIVETGHYLATAVANLIAILGIRRLVITGRIAPFGDVLLAAVREEVNRRVLPDLAQAVEIEILAQKPDTILLGAAALLLTNELGLARLERRLTTADAQPRTAISVTTG